MDDHARTMKVVWTVVERGTSNGAVKSYWTRVGVGFVNRDGSINLKLDAIPTNGTLQVREWEPLDRRSEGTDGSSPRARSKALPTGESLV